MATETTHSGPATTGASHRELALRWTGSSLPFDRELRASRVRPPSFADVHASLRRLEQDDGAPGMLHAAAEEVSRACVFAGAVVCSLQGQTVLVESAWIEGRPDLSEATVALARAAPPQVDPSVEADLSRRPAPVVVGDPRDDARVSPLLGQLLTALLLLIVPIATGSDAVGLLYAWTADSTFDWADRELAWIFAAGLAQLVVAERLRMQLELQDAALRRLTDTVRTLEHAPSAGSGALARLTAREREVLALMAQGCTNEEMATRLVVAQGTIKSHVQSVLRKLGATNRTEAVARLGRHLPPLQSAP